MAAAMDCMCWTDGSCMTGADWQPWWGLLEASLLSWWPELVALDLVRTMQSFCWRKINYKNKIFPHRQHQLMIQNKISRLNALGFNGKRITWETWKDEHTIKGDRGGLAKNPPMVKSVFLSNSGIPISLKMFEKLTLFWRRWVLTWSGYLSDNFPYHWGGRKVWS